MDEIPQVKLLIDALAALRPQSSRTTLRQLLSRGQVRVNGEIVKIGRLPTVPDDRIEILPLQIEKPASPLLPPIVFEDDSLIVIDKPAGLLSSTQKGERRPTVLAVIRQYMWEKRPSARVGLIHRLDRDASGLMVLSLNESAYQHLKQQFYDHAAGRIYAAIVRGKMRPQEGTIRHRLVEYVDGTVHRTHRTDKGEDAVTHYQTTDVVGDFSLLRVRLETGRKHQIRAHLATTNHPIVGDVLYGGEPAERLMLAGIELNLDHPVTGERLSLRADLPEPLSRLMRGTP
jgi:23S rRNA pseudouridine1911/1915/1917 synthase